MPFYDYKCRNCGHIELNVRKSISENVSTYQCQKCGMWMTLVPNRTLFSLKGNGWAKDGYSKTKEEG